MTSTTVRVDAIEPISRAEATTLAATEYARLADQLSSLDADDWVKPTDCPGWDVRAVAGHCVGMMSDVSSLPRLLRRSRAATARSKRTGEEYIDAMTAMQVADHADLPIAELIALTKRRGPEAARGRARVPRPLRAIPTTEEVGGKRETWRIGYLLDVILTRDPWMHRVDIARATDRDPVLTADHDGRIVADVVAEWARRHGRPFALILTGPAGGRFASGAATGPPSPDPVNVDPITIDAVEFCRALSGRADRQHLFDQEVPF